MFLHVLHNWLHNFLAVLRVTGMICLVIERESCKVHHRDCCFAAVSPSGVEPMREEEHGIKDPFFIWCPEVDVVFPASSDDFPLEFCEVLQIGPPVAP